MPDIDAMWQWAVDTCNDPNVGYSRGSGYGEPANRNAGVENGVTYYDCSSFVNFALNAGGFETPNYAPNHGATTTWDLPAELTRLGWHQIGGGVEILPGDIGLNPDTHTEICYSGGKPGSAVFMGAHTHNAALVNQVSIGSSSGNTSYAKEAGYWQQIWRYEDGGAQPSATAKFSFYVCAAMCGCWWRESGCNPGIWESLVSSSWDHEYQYDGIGGYGLGQWTNVGTSHGRCYNLSQFLAANDYNADSGDGECDFVVQEAYWGGATGQTEKINAFLNSDSEDLEELVTEFLSSWEGVPGNAYQERLTHAQTALPYLEEHWQDDVTWYVGNRFLSDSEWLNNCVCVYQWFNLNFAKGTNTGTGGGTTSSSSSSGSGGGVGNTNSNDEENTDWYQLFLSMLSLLGSNSNTDEILKILTRRGK